MKGTPMKIKDMKADVLHGVLTAVLAAVVIGMAGKMVEGRDTIIEVKRVQAEHQKVLDDREAVLSTLREGLAELKGILSEVRRK